MIVTTAKEVPWAAFSGDAVRAVLDASPVGILITDGEDRILWLNRALRRQLDVSWPEIVGEEFQTLPIERVEDSVGGREQYRIQSGIPDDEEVLDASVTSVDDGAGGTLNIRFFVHHVGQGLRASLLEHLGFRRGTDPLSGVMDKDAIMRVLDSEISRTRRYANELSILLIQVSPDLADVDADTAVIAAGRVLSDGMRWVDAAGRVSDTEFLLVLPETDAEGARVLADKLRARFGTEDSEHPALEAKVAFASWRKGDDAMFMIDRARQRLSIGKR
jgi:GGDEF domain-containing protein